MSAHTTDLRACHLRPLSFMYWFAIAAFALLATGQQASAQTATTTTLSITSGSSAVISVSSSTVVTLTATVMAGSTPVTPGQVKFCDAAATYCEDFHILGTAQLTASGTATVKFRPTVGSHSYKAVFVGTKTSTTSSSAASSLTVTGLNPTTTSLAYSPNANSPTQLTVGVVGTGLLSQAPSGAVSFTDASTSTSLGTSTLTSQGTGMWASTLPPTSGYGLGSPAVADFNGDGIPDIAMFGASQLTVLLGTASGSYTEVTTPYTAIAGLQNAELVVGDFNQDGIPDLAVSTCTADYSSPVEIFLGNGDGTFTAGPTYSLSVYGDAQDGYYSPIVIADFNHDGIPDLAVLTETQGLNVTTLLGKGDGTFTAVAALTNVYDLGGSEEAFALAVGDFNGDGIPDLAFAVGPSNEVQYGCYKTARCDLNTYIGNGDGTFNPTLYNLSQDIHSNPTNIFVADFNGDGIPDIALNVNLAIPGDLGVTNTNSVSLYIGTGSGTFTAAPSPNQQIGVPYTYLGNFTGSGNPEMWGERSDGSGSSVFVYDSSTGTFDLTNGPPTLSSYVPGQGTFNEGEVTAADINGDRITDFVSPNFSTLSGFIDIIGSVSTGSIPTSGFPSGGYTIQADYPGDSNFASSSANIGSPQSTTLTLSLSPNSGLKAGQTATLTATLAPYFNSGGNTDGESVDFYINSALAGTGTLSNGVATFALLQSTIGTYTLNAAFPGYSGFANSTSNTITAIFAGNQPTLVLSASPSTSAYGQPVTLTATLSGYYGTTDGAKVTFMSSGQLLGTGTLASGIAAIATSVLPIGTDSVTAVYSSNDGYNLNATSNTLAYTVNPVPPVLLTPTPGSQLSGSTATFTWTPGSGVSRYTLWVGTQGPGTFNIFGTTTTATSATVTGLPTDGVYVYVTLQYEINGVWSITRYTYTAAGQPVPPVLTAPTPSSHLSGSTTTFTWTPGSGVSRYTLWVGTQGPGSFNIFGTTTTATSATVTGLPTDGVNVYVTLQYEINGVWSITRYTYTAAGQTAPPVLTTPTPNTTLSGSNVTFTWTPGTGVTGYQLLVATYGPGYFNVYGSGQITTTSATVPNIPTNGKPIYVTLWYRINGVWQSTPYTYTAQ